MADGIGIEAIWLGRRARRFRQIIDGADRSRWGAPFKSFPQGSCGAVSEMFAVYLFEEHAVSTRIMGATHAAKSERYGTHSWIERDELIIDLTCDSFLHDPLPAPFVGVDRTWHDQWKVDFSSSIGDWLSANRLHFNAFFGTAYAQVLRVLGS